MKVRIEIDRTIDEDELIIRCGELNGNIRKIQQYVLDMSKQSNISFYKDNVEYFLRLGSVLFFETSDKGVNAHTADNVFQTKQKLYELEEILPSDFVRVSKSTILNITHIFSIQKSITSASTVEFNNTHKQVYVSRSYYKLLKQRLDERRNYETR